MTQASIWESIDQVAGIEFRSGAPNPGRLNALYDAARARMGGQPIAFSIATRLAEAVKPGAAVILTTGAGGPPWLFRGETDGPPGLAGLARALALLGAWPIILTEERSIDPVTATLVAAGVSVLDESSAKARPTTATLLPFPTDPAVAEKMAAQFIDQYNPAALIAIEKTSPNRLGVIHSVSGKAWTPSVDFVRIEFLVEECRKRGILTVGIADQGNEIGFGLIEDVVRSTIPFANVCQCSCGEGMASAVSTEMLSPASISNWGCYAIEAALAIVKRLPDLLHDADVEVAMIRACVAAGGVDGLTSRQILAVDGTRLEVQAAIITLLQQLVSAALATQSVDY
jgi:hypothetical protein